ncbi:KIP3 [Candida pseudojiufengensis]|uniref:KIP3 n=1 Tax=Candida pseudojiufengensis TaxID=497109 RepID=UPI002224B035|nr:KIP3 [Candida pseudojiufengensis]KAI5961641.1 KIP3 [Candida pseudojiufengensis]
MADDKINTISTFSSTATTVVNVPAIKQSSITVAVRVRPFTENETTRLIKSDQDDIFLSDGSLSEKDIVKQKFMSQVGIRKIINVVDDRMLIFDPPESNPIAKLQKNLFPKGSRIREHKFVFDKLFDEDASQDQVYQATTRPLLESVLDGYNATVFAYGATGCGKTHTISGTLDNPGVIFLTMKELYEKIEELSDTKLIDISLSYLEIYNETIRDLLNPETDYKKLVIREDSNNKITVSNLSSHRPESVNEVMHLIMAGNANRTSSPTEANATSSRSHAVLQINVVQRNRTGDIKEEHTFATLSIIDLAGSERAAATKNRGVRLNEGANINKSLLALGNCINALCDPKRRNHVPYRDSKLTRLLKFSLGGNCKTVMIVCVAPSSIHYDETLNTLKYADRAKEIKTKLIRNQHNLDRHVGSYLKMITEQKQEIEELRARESQITDMAVEKRKKVEQNTFKLLQETIHSIRNNISRYSQEKFKKLFLLAKRKLLLLQKIETEQLLSPAPAHINHYDHYISIIYNLRDQIISKIENQIVQIEKQYSQSYEIDHILNESANQQLKRLQDDQGWTNSHTEIFNELISSLHNQVQIDLLVKSSTLYDKLIHSLYDYYYPSRAIANYLSQNHGNNDEILLQSLIQGLENLVNGNFETAMESHAIEYFKARSWEEFEIDIQNQNQPTKKPKLTSSPPKISTIPIHYKRPSIKRIKSSSIHKTPRKSKLSNNNNITNNSNGRHHSLKLPSTTTQEPDSSIDEITFQNNSDIMMYNETEEEEKDSPDINKIVDLDLQLNLQLDSPPPPPLLKNNSFNFDKVVTRNNANESKLNNGNLNFNMTESKLPLLNTQAASKIQQDIEKDNRIC